MGVSSGSWNVSFVFLVVFLLNSAPGQTLAREPSTFLIAAAPGYGVEDCLAEGGECGQVVANAWCTSQGRGEALKFGRSDSQGTAGGATQPYFITCGE